MRYLTTLLLSISMLVGCNKPDSQITNQPLQKIDPMSPQVNLTIGEQGDALLKRYPNLIRIDRQPAGLDFYQIDWDKRPRGIVTIAHGKYTILIDDVVGVMGTFDHQTRSEGINEFLIKSGLSAPPPDLITHDEARLKTYAILQRILQVGWRPIVGRSDVRLNGRARQDYVLHVSKTLGLDPNYLPNFEEWMQIDSRTDWKFYADHLYLTVNFTREHTMTAPSKPGAYLLSFNLKSEAEYFRAYVGSESRAIWKEKLPTELKDGTLMRNKEEAELRAKGIKIDEDYQDPPVPDLK